MYERIQSALGENGELLIRTASGREYELHTHNVNFESEPMIHVDAGDEQHWIDARTIESYRIHYDS